MEENTSGHLCIKIPFYAPNLEHISEQSSSELIQNTLQRQSFTRRVEKQLLEHSL